MISSWRCDGLANMRMVVAVAGGPPRGDAVDQLAPVGEIDAAALGARHGERRRRRLHLRVGQPEMREALEPGGQSRPSPSMTRTRHRRPGRARPSARGRWSRPGLGVVSSRAPQKIELAPARKHSACISSLMSSRPADSRTIDAGMADARDRDACARIRARRAPASRPSGVPATRTSRLIGTLSGCSGKVASAAIMPTRSVAALAHADDAAAAHASSRRRAHGRACRAGPDRCAW